MRLYINYLSIILTAQIVLLKIGSGSGGAAYMIDLSAIFHEKAFINGQWRDADNGATFDVRNPATGEIIGHGSFALCRVRGAGRTN